MRILVTYATCHGSTAEIARRIANRLESSGDAVECLAMSEVSHLSGYEAVVAGSAIYDQDWLDEARAFVSRFAPDLGALPVWLFSVGMPAALPGPLESLAMQEGTTWPQSSLPWSALGGIGCSPAWYARSI